MTQKSILLSGAYVHSNVGDRALRDAAVRQVQIAYPNCEIVISGMDDPRQYPEFEGVRNIGSMRRWAGHSSTPISRVTRHVLVSGIGLAWNRGPKALYHQAERLLPGEVQRELAAIRCADHVVSLVGAGPYIQGASEPGLGKGLEIVLQMSHIAVAKRAQVGVTLTPQSYGPFPSGWRRSFISKTLSGINVLVREDESMHRLRDLQLAQPDYSRAVDLAFTLPSLGRDTGPCSWRESSGISEADTLVGVTIRKCLPVEDQKRFESVMAGFIDLIQRMPRHRVVLIPMATNAGGHDDDREVQRSVIAKCKRTSHLICLGDEIDARAVIAQLDFLIGNRFHSVIFALLERIPSIGLAYEQKTEGILNDLGLGEWAITASDVTAKGLAYQLQRLKYSREAFLSTLNRNIPGYTGKNELAHVVSAALVAV